MRCFGTVVFLGGIIGVLVLGVISSWDEHAAKNPFSYETTSADGEVHIHGYDVGKYIFFVMICFAFVVTALVVIPVCVIFLRRRCKTVREKVASVTGLSDAPAIAAIIPCYLPNEQGIIMESARHVLENVDSPGQLNVWVVYNTPKDIPEVEQQLADLAALSGLPDGKGLPRNRTLNILRVHGSKSKAENLNAALDKIDNKYVVIYDADHHPDADSLMLLYEKLIREGIDCVQGSTYIRNLSAGLLGRFIDAEFFVTHFMFFPALKLLVRSGLFGGSNALWVRDVLAGKKFSHTMQTEDIDLSIRSLIDRRKIDFCPEARSGELAPVSCRALYRQRLRWSIGWDQVSLKYFQGIVFGNGLTVQERWSLFHVLYVRWFSQLCAIIAGVITPVLGLVWHFDPKVWGKAIFFGNAVLFNMYVLNVICTVAEAVLQTHHRKKGCQSWKQVFFVLLFMIFGSVYVLILSCLLLISLLKISRGTVGGWVVTARAKGATIAIPEACVEEGGVNQDGGESPASETPSHVCSGVDEAMPYMAIQETQDAEQDVSLSACSTIDSLSAISMMVSPSGDRAKNPKLIECMDAEDIAARLATTQVKVSL
jgi:cellulose synthase/poly-beta-1,6-N-acetylglucosamine synthase-like glycosyltransferase